MKAAISLWFKSVLKSLKIHKLFNQNSTYAYIDFEKIDYY